MQDGKHWRAEDDCSSRWVSGEMRSSRDGRCCPFRAAQQQPGQTSKRQGVLGNTRTSALMRGTRFRMHQLLPQGLGTSEHGWESGWKAPVTLGDWDICSPFLLPTGHPNPAGSCAHSAPGEVASSHEGMLHGSSHRGAQAELAHPFGQSCGEGDGWFPEGDKRTECFWDNHADLCPPAWEGIR